MTEWCLLQARPNAVGVQRGRGVRDHDAGADGLRSAVACFRGGRSAGDAEGQHKKRCGNHDQQALQLAGETHVAILPWLASVRSESRIGELCQQSLHPIVDVLNDRTHFLYRQSRRVVEVPIHVAFAQVDRACVSAPHGDDHV